MINEGVDALRDEFELPGMRILQFGFGNRGAHSYLPHRFERNTVVYTGTHDNDTTLGWWQNGATPEEKEAVGQYVGLSGDGPAWALMRAASASVADICLFPLQDAIGAGSEGRMNVPSAAEGNWSWRYDRHALTAELAAKLFAMADGTDRTLEAERDLLKLKEEAAAEQA